MSIGAKKYIYKRITFDYVKLADEWMLLSKR